MEKATRDDMILSVAGLVKHQARKIHPPPGVEFDDLVSDGLAAVTAAAEKYDPAGGATWSTYAATVARNAMLHTVEHAKRGCRAAPNGLLRLDAVDPDGERYAAPVADPRTADPAELAAVRDELAPRRRATVRARDLAAALPTPAQVADQVTRLRAAMFAEVSEADVAEVMAGVVARAKKGESRDVKLLMDLLAPARSGVTVNQQVATVVVNPSDVS